MSTSIGGRNSIKTRVKEKSPSYYFVAWPCHLILNIVCKASQMIFFGTSEFSLEDMLLTYTIILTRALSENRF